MSRRSYRSCQWCQWRQWCPVATSTGSSSGPPGVGLLAELEGDEALRAGHGRHGPDAAEEFEQLLVALADQLDEDVERAGRDDDVVDLLYLGQVVGYRDEVALALDGDHR